ncbi:MAG: DUF434 domain-containing protein [Phaeodactylibacter sp.]|nr:DUF434 domain-containing protein [Phaeodactylibacter sp.]
MTSRNRGKHSNDDKLFAPKWHPILKEAVDDLGYLFSRGYAANAAIQVVGNRYKLNKRQRMAVLRISASAEEIALRKQSACLPNALAGQALEIDGFNLLILLESALSGAYVFHCRDGAYRDISSVHGSYKRVLQTENAIVIIGKALQTLKVGSVRWYLDQPVSNSGRLKTRLLEISAEEGFGWEVELVYSPDKVLAESTAIVVSSDGWILNQVPRWFNFGEYLMENELKAVQLIRI